MERWALLIIAVYVLMLATLAFPALLFLANFSTDEAVQAYGLPFCWIWTAVLVLGESLLLFIPVSLAQRRLKPQRRLLIPIFATVFFLWLLAICAGVCIYFALWDEKSGRHHPDDTAVLIFTIAGTLLFWAFWSWLFLRFRRTDDSSTLTSRLMRYLLAGSILELLIAIPCHIIVRRRDECCSPAFTGIGIYTGIAVMLMSFGPGVFILYAHRRDQLLGLHPRCPTCGYDLRATPLRCPECGTVVPKRCDPRSERDQAE